MKVLMLKKVPRVGVEGDVITVTPGYALNFLFPRGLAKVATPKDEKAAQEKKQKQTMKSSEIQGKAAEAKAMLEKAGGLVFAGKVSDHGTLYASVTEKDIVKLIKEKTTLDIEPKHVSLPDAHVKALGEYIVSVKLTDKISAQVHLTVKAL